MNHITVSKMTYYDNTHKMEIMIVSGTKKDIKYKLYTISTKGLEKTL